MGTSKTNRRSATRKEVTPIQVSHLTALDDFTKIAKNGSVIEASATGLLIHIDREDLVPQVLRKNLSLDCLIGDKVCFHLEEMNLEISGTITRTKLSGKKGFLVAVDYSDDAPEYWRECLTDLLPAPGELDGQ